MGGKWFEIWFEDKQAMMATMARNIAADLDAGYNYFGECIQKQKADIEAYKNQFDKEMDILKWMDTDQQIERWCYLDLKKRGAIC